MKPTSVDEYLGQFNGETRARLELMRQIISETAPGAVESLSYGLIGYKYKHKPLVYFGGFASHIGFYATPNGHEKFAKEFANYKQGKGSVQLPLSEPIPSELIREVTRFRIGSIDY